MDLPHNLPDGFEFKALFDQSREPICVYDADLNFIYVNQAYLDATKHKIEIVMGAYVYEAFPETNIPIVRDMFSTALSGNIATSPAVPYEYKRSDESPAKQYWQSRITPILDAEGNVKFLLERALNVTKEILLSDKNSTIVAELNHRVRNLMTVLQSVASITAQNARDVKSYTADFQNRLSAIARTYHGLATQGWQGLPIRELIESELARVADTETGRYTLTGPDIALTVKSTKDASLVLHEMVTNAVKYGCFTRPDGHLNVSWKVTEEWFVIEWEETGIIDLQPPTATGFGSKLISMMPYMKVERDFRPTGLFLRCSIAVEESIDRVDFRDQDPA